VVVVREIHLSWDELRSTLEGGGPPTDDDVSITTDGRRLDSKEAALEFLAELEAEREAAAQASFVGGGRA
jgi:hypothetical protein